MVEGSHGGDAGRSAWTASSSPAAAALAAVGLTATLGLAALACAPEAETSDPAAFERARSRASSPEREWRTYLGDSGVSHASPLDAIHRGNVASLEVAWTYDAGDLPEAGGTQIQFNPLVVEGVLYGASPSLRTFALDASTGEELWSFDPGIDPAAWQNSRGAVYWADGDDERLIAGAGPFLFALDPRTGRPIEGFGDGGRIDLREGLGRDVSDDMMGVVASTPGSVFEDLLIMGGRVNEGHGAAPGHIRAFDLRTGEQHWIFHTIPRPGEPGHETWPPDAWERVGGANAWAGFSVDTERDSSSPLPARPPSTSTAATASGTTCTRTPCSPSTPARASAAGTTRRCATTSGTGTSRRHPTSSRSSATAGASPPWPR